MSRASNKVHLLAGKASHATASHTVCGRVGWKSRNSATEYDDVVGKRFDAVDDSKIRAVDCIVCLRTINFKKEIENALRRD